MNYLADRILTLLNLRVLVATIAMWWALGLPLPEWIQRVTRSFDHTIFRLAMDFSALPSSQAQITVVHVSPVEYDSWLADIPGAERLEALFNLPTDLGDRRPVVGVVLERPLTMIQSQAESLLGDIHQGRRTKDHLYNEVNDVLSRRERLIAQLQGPNVVLGVEGALYKGGVNIASGELHHWAALLPTWVQGALWHSPPQKIPLLAANPVFQYAPIWLQHELSRSLVQRRGEWVFPGFELLFLRAVFNAQQAITEPASTAPIIWEPDRGFYIGPTHYPASAFGEVIPLYGKHSNLRSALKQISLDAALADQSLSSLVLVGRDGSQTLELLAQSVAAMADDAQIIEPLWWRPLQKGTLLVLALWLCTVVPRLTRYWRVTTTVMICGALSLLGLLAQSLYQLWLPVGQVILYLLAGLFLISLWQRQSRKVDDMSHTLQTTLLELADQRMANGDYRLAMETLGRCQKSGEVYGRLYQLGETLTEQNQVELALGAFAAIRERKRRYKDVPQKLKALTQKKQSKDLVDSSSVPTSGFDQTQVLTSEYPSSDTLGRYEIRRELGRGANGTVFLGYDPSIDREVAIKTLNYEQYDSDHIEGIKERFFKEARAVGRLSHPHIVQVYDMGEEGNLAYMTMDYARGNPLSDFIQPASLLPMATVYRIIMHVAEAVHYAHQQEIIHRDIKPSNIIFMESPFAVRVTDFGIARLADHSQTATGEILGSPLYMAPEQLRGETASQASDIFSLGVTFYQLLTGVLPFNGDNIANLTYAIINEKHQSVRRIRGELPTSATRITNMALQKKSEHRYVAALDFAEALKKALKRDFGVDVSKAHV